MKVPRIVGTGKSNDAEHVRNAKDQLAREAIRTATSSVGVHLVNLTGAVDELLSRSSSN